MNDSTFAFLLTLIVAVLYAVIRSFHDSHIRNGKWKTWAFVEGVGAAILTVGGCLWGFGLPWWLGAILGPLFAFVFWLVFDCLVGYLFTGNILYIGTSGFDLKMRKMFLYNKPIFGWKETGNIRGIFFKSFWLVLLIGAYFNLI